MNTLNLEIKRLYRNHTLHMIILLLFLITIVGIGLNKIYYDDLHDSRFLLMSLYNSFTQFTYLVLAFSFVSVFCKDFQNGGYIWYRQQGYSFKTVTIAKFLSLLLITLPVINIILFVTEIISDNHDYNFFSKIIACANINIVYIVVLAFFLSIIFRKVILATMTMYGIYILCNILNLWGYGIFNPVDGNSITTYYLGKLINPLQSHYSLNKIHLSDFQFMLSSIAIPIVWIVFLLFLTIIIQSIKKKN